MPAKNQCGGKTRRKKQKKKRKMNRFFKAKEKARKANGGQGAESFTYKNKEGVTKVYKKFLMPNTKMVAYKSA